MFNARRTESSITVVFPVKAVSQGLSIDMAWSGIDAHSLQSLDTRVHAAGRLLRWLDLIDCLHYDRGNVVGFYWADFMFIWHAL